MEHAEDWDATDLEMIGDLLYIAGYYVEGGIREFGRWSKALTRRFGKGALPMGRSRKPFVKLSEEQKQAALLEVKRLLENEQELRRQYRQNAPPGYLEIKSPGRPSVEEQRLMSLCRVDSLEDLELVMSSPLSEEWLARQGTRNSNKPWRTGTTACSGRKAVTKPGRLRRQASTRV